MIVVDTSALMAIALNEPLADACFAILDAEPEVAISAGTLAETLVVAGQRGVAAEMENLIGTGGIEVVPFTGESARRVAAAYRRWGKGVHPASLNPGDCFAYALAMERDCPLLFIGNDFVNVDVQRALQ